MLVTAGCTETAPRILSPLRIDDFCGSKQARPTGIASVMTSTSDQPLDDAPTAADVRKAVRAGDGTIAYWNDQLLSLPQTAKQVGETDGYVRVRAVGIPPVSPNATSRHIYLEVRDGRAYRWFTLQAYDVQNVCVEGKRDI